MYTFQETSASELIISLSERLKQRRLEKGITRDSLSAMSGVPTPTITKFEREHTISLKQYLSLCIAMGYTSDIQDIMLQPKYKTIEELEQINRNKNRRRGHN